MRLQTLVREIEHAVDSAPQPGGKPPRRIVSLIGGSLIAHEGEYGLGLGAWDKKF